MTGRTAGFGGGASGATAGRITLDLLDRQEREQDSFITLEEARELTRGMPGVTVDVDAPEEGPPVGDPVSIEMMWGQYGQPRGWRSVRQRGGGKLFDLGAHMIDQALQQKFIAHALFFGRGRNNTRNKLVKRAL